MAGAKARGLKGNMMGDTKVVVTELVIDFSELGWDDSEATPIRDTVHEVPTVDEEREALPDRWRIALERVRRVVRRRE